MADSTLAWIGATFDYRERSFFVLLLFCLAGYGCSFHSNQLEALKTIIRKESGPEPQWLFSWRDQTEKVFAVNAGSSIFFANSDGVLVHFNGSFVEKIEGVRLKTRMAMDISITKTKLEESEVFSYRGLTADFGDLLCGLPSEVSSKLALKTGIMRTKVIRQNCTIDENFVYQSITLNESRQLVGLQFVLHPAHEPATIRYNPI